MVENFERARLIAALRRVSQGDRGALREVYQGTSARLFGVCLRILGDRQEAEDVLQDVYLTVWRRADSFEATKASPIAWLVSVARTRAIDKLRAGGGRVGADPIASPAAQPETNAEHARLAGCIEALDPKHAAAVRTAFFEGLTYEALAGVAEAPLDAVKGWIRRGLMSLDAADIPDMTAAEYALGVLDGEERRAAIVRLSRDPAFAAEVADWGARLAPLAHEIPAVEPSALVWNRVAAALGTPPGIWNNVVFWRGATVAGIAAATACLVIVALTR